MAVVVFFWSIVRVCVFKWAGENEKDNITRKTHFETENGSTVSLFVCDSERVFSASKDYITGDME